MSWVAHGAGLREVEKHDLDVDAPLLQSPLDVLGLREGGCHG